MGWLYFGIFVCVIILIVAISKLVSLNADDKARRDARATVSYEEATSELARMSLMLELKKRITPKLTSPASAVWCLPEQLIISPTKKKNTFHVTGFVDSQNGFGAMLRTTFSVDCECFGGTAWVVGLLINYS